MNEARGHACTACGRRFVVVAGRAVADPPRCACGALLRAMELDGGVYELRRSRKASRRRPSKKPDQGDAKIPREPDLGYGESHGYGPAHGGPSGPGDAPADEPAAERKRVEDSARQASERA